MKGDTPRSDERGTGGRRAERERKRRKRDGMGIVRVNDRGIQFSDDARQFPAGAQIDFGARPEANQIVAFRRTPRELTLRMRDEHGSVASLAKPEHGEQHLPLAATPGSGGIDMDREHFSYEG
jgi:hypothetical protein